MSARLVEVGLTWRIGFDDERKTQRSSGALKMQDKTLQDRTMTDKLAGPDFAGQDNDGQEKHHAW